MPNVEYRESRRETTSKNRALHNSVALQNWMLWITCGMAVFTVLVGATAVAGAVYQGPSLLPGKEPEEYQFRVQRKDVTMRGMTGRETSLGLKTTDGKHVLVTIIED